MILKRFVVVLVDLLISCMASVGAYLAGADYIYSIIIVYLVTVVIELIYTGGKTLGTIVTRIQPLNFNGRKPGIVKLIFYHLIFTIFLFNPTYDLITIFLPVIVIIPLQFKKGRYTGVLDTLFKIHWIEGNRDI